MSMKWTKRIRHPLIVQLLLMMMMIITSSQPTKQLQDRYRWLEKDFIGPNSDLLGLDVTSGAVSLHTSLEYFQRFVSEDMIQALTESTNQYSFQKTATTINTNTKELDIHNSDTSETCDCSEETMLRSWGPPNGVPSRRSCEPPTDVRRDVIAHFPVKTMRRRCRRCKKGCSDMLCRK